MAMAKLQLAPPLTLEGDSTIIVSVQSRPQPGQYASDTPMRILSFALSAILALLPCARGTERGSPSVKPTLNPGIIRPADEKTDKLPKAAFGAVHEDLIGVHFDHVRLKAPAKFDRADLSVWGVRLPVDDEWREGADKAHAKIRTTVWKNPKHTQLGKSFITLRRGKVSRKIDVTITELTFQPVGKKHYKVVMKFKKNSELDRAFGTAHSHTFAGKMEIVRN